MSSSSLHLVNIPRPGYIYLVNAVGTDKFKIGKTAGSIAHRIKDLQIGSPIRLRYVYHAYVARMSRTERELHYRFSCFRSVGEWFALSDANVKECITLMRLVQIDQSLPLPPQEEEEEDREEEVEDLSVISLRIPPRKLSLSTFASPVSETEREKIKEAREANKTNTWIIENILKMKGRKFAEGKAKLQALLDQFGGAQES